MSYHYQFWIQKTIDPYILHDLFVNHFQAGPLRLKMVTKRNGTISVNRDLSVDLDAIIPTISNDLGSGIVIVISPLDTDIGHRAVMKARRYGTGVYHLAEVLLMMLIERDYSLVPTLREQFENVPRALIQTADMLIRCGLNASLAAEKLYIHRNTFNYRLAKFIELTDLDIRDYWTGQYYYVVRSIIKTK